jgi:hypothetical protein
MSKAAEWVPRSAKIKAVHGNFKRYADKYALRGYPYEFRAVRGARASRTPVGDVIRVSAASLNRHLGKLGVREDIRAWIIADLLASTEQFPQSAPKLPNPNASDVSSDGGGESK